MRLACLIAAVAAAAASGQVQTGTLLVATDRNRDAGFAQTVIVVVQHDRARSVGLVINRRLGEPVAAIFPDLKASSAGKEPLWAGGPVALGVNALARSSQGPALIHGVHLLSDRTAIHDFLAHGARPGTVRVFAGLCSWGPRQLEAEIDRGLWKTAAAGPALLFDPHPEALWHRLSK